MTREKFLAAYYETINDLVDANSVHPEDIMATVLTATEAIYHFVVNLPTNAFNVEYKEE